MKGTTQRPLSDKEVEALDGEYKLLHAKLQNQTLEQVNFLAMHIGADPNLNADQRTLLTRLLRVNDDGIAPGFVMQMFRVTSANVLQKPHIQVSYNIDDALYAYLRRPDGVLPKKLIGFLDGGVDITKKAQQSAVVDDHPLIGKTKVR